MNLFRDDDGKLDKLLIGLIIFLIIWIVGGFIWITHDNVEEDLACKELGFERAKHRIGIDYCEDSEDNLHYIKMDCEPWYWVDCTAKPISVGDVRVK